MRYLLISILSLYLTINVFGQNSPDSGFTNKAEARNQLINGVKEGKWLEYDSIIDNFEPNKYFQMDYRLTIYRNGKIIGIVRYYNTNGLLWLETPYINFQRNGIQKQFNRNGTLYRETPYLNDVQNGIEKVYYDNGVLMAELPFVMGELIGEEKWYYPDGKLQKVTHYNEYGIETGGVLEYDKNGNKINKK